MTSSEEDTVQLFADGDAPDFANLATWFDASAGRYFGYEPSQAIRDISYIAYRRFAPTGTPDRFASVWPRIWELNECAYGEWAPMAVLDTGVMTQHPLLKPQILYAMDFTGEGVEDDVGHGTAVTMRLRMQFPGQPPPFLVVLKVVGRSGRGSEDNLLAAFDWIRRFNQAATQPIRRPRSLRLPCSQPPSRGAGERSRWRSSAACLSG